MSDVDCPLLQAHLARCKAGYSMSSLLVWPRYGHVPDNELDSNELDWIGLARPSGVILRHASEVYGFKTLFFNHCGRADP